MNPADIIDGMTWTAPAITRADEPFVAGEREMLQGFLDFGRRTLLLKCAGLTGEQLVERAVPPSRLSLLGLVRHLTDVERTWLPRRFGCEDIACRNGSPGEAFEAVHADRAGEDLAALLAEWAAADRAIAGLPLEHVYISDRWGPMQLRWAYCHLTSEYDRHNGHADLLRERIDGATGS